MFISLNSRNKSFSLFQLSHSDDHQNPPLPLDLDVPYNDELSIYNSNIHHDDFRTTTTNIYHIEQQQKWERDRRLQEQHKQESVITWRTNAEPTDSGHNNVNIYNAGAGYVTFTTPRNRNIIVNNYNPSNRNQTSNVRTFTKHKNIIVSSYNRTTSSSSHDEDNSSNDSSADNNNFINNFFNTNWSTMFTGGERDRTSSSSRPSHKTHVEIITKNGATKKPNIIVNNYNPDVIMSTTNNQNPYNSMSMTMSNSIPGRQDNNVHDSNSAMRAMYDRKITCMLYLQADHTFFQKMGSDESSIEAITRHVQRANSIYRNTGKLII